MKPFYATGLVFLTVCSLWVVAETLYPNHTASLAYNPSVTFGSLGTLRP